MENHPIPQDVTGFQFKLIGEMTVKQFAYLAGAVILAWITFSLPIIFIIKFPLILLFLITGFSFSFIPIGGRPADVMFSYFIKDFFTPNQYLFQRKGRQILPPVTYKKPDSYAKHPHSADSREKLKIYLNKLPQAQRNRLDEKESMYFSSVTGIFTGNLPPVPMTQPANPTPEEEQGLPISNEGNPEKEALEKEALLIERELEAVKAQEAKQENPQTAHEVHQKAMELEIQLRETLSQKAQLERELLSLQKKLETQKQDVYTPAVARLKEETQNVKQIPKSMTKKAGLPIMSDDPNLIAGIIKDPRGNVLPNILIEVKDKEGNPVRAFKTNGLGQFLSATPLLNGIYTVEFEDPEGKNKFDTIELVATGDILMPIEVTSQDEREDLRKALFG